MRSTSPRAPRFVRFGALDASTMNRDFQTHTAWTDGRNSVAEMLAAAADRGLAEFAFTEHARASSSYWPAFFAEIDAEARHHPTLRVFRGFEVKIVDESGTLDISDDMRAAADLVLGSVHSFPGSSVKDADRVNARALGAEETHRREFALAKAFVQRQCGAVLSHPGGMSLRTFGTFPLAYFDELLALCAQLDVPFEINSSYHRDVLRDLVPLLRRHDPLISIGSDAHSAADVGACRDLLRGVLA